MLIPRRIISVQWYRFSLTGKQDCDEGEDEVCTQVCGLPALPFAAVSVPVDQTRIVGGVVVCNVGCTKLRKAVLSFSSLLYPADVKNLSSVYSLFGRVKFINFSYPYTTLLQKFRWN